MAKVLSLVVTVGLLFACTDDWWAGVTFPPDQQIARMAYKRLNKHGDLNPVLEDGQPFENWEFSVAGTSPATTGGEDQNLIWRLEDGSGIEYLWERVPTDALEGIGVDERLTGTGEVVKVERDLLAGRITATVRLTSWNARD